MPRSVRRSWVTKVLGRGQAHLVQFLDDLLQGLDLGRVNS